MGGALPSTAPCGGLPLPDTAGRRARGRPPGCARRPPHGQDEERNDTTVTDTVGPSGADRLGFAPGNVVQEFGWADDVDDDLRGELEELVGGELVDEDYDDVTDGVVVWFRQDDGDLTDLLVDVQTVLDDGGLIWCSPPSPGGRDTWVTTTSRRPRTRPGCTRRARSPSRPTGPRRSSGPVAAVADDASTTGRTTPPGPGDPAPDFTLPDTHGTPVHLADLRGGPVLLVFYPFAFSGSARASCASCATTSRSSRRPASRCSASRATRCSRRRRGPRRRASSSTCSPTSGRTATSRGLRRPRRGQRPRAARLVPARRRRDRPVVGRQPARAAP